MRKKIVILFVSLCLSFSSAFIAHADIRADVTIAEDIQVDDYIRQKVYGEILDGNISNEEDVIKVALEQYQERLERGNQRSANKNSEIDDSLSITQMVGCEVNEKGELIEEIATTNLLVLDKYNNIARASSFDTSNSGYLNEYSIAAVMTVSVTNNTSNLTVRFNSFRTRLTYGTAMTAGSLVQTSNYAKDILESADDKTQRFAYPQAGRDYVYIPNNLEMISYANYGERACHSTISVSSRSFDLGYVFRGSHAFPNGEWITEYH